MEGPALQEIDTTKSLAIDRMIFDPRRGGSLLVRFRNNPKVYRYLNVDSELANSFASSASLGASIAELKKLKRFEVVEGFPTHLRIGVFGTATSTSARGNDVDVQAAPSASRRRRGDARAGRSVATDASSAAAEESQAAVGADNYSSAERVNVGRRGDRGQGRGSDSGTGRSRGSGRGKRDGRGGRGRGNASSSAIGGHRADYSVEWLRAIEGASDCSATSKEYLRDLIDLLDKQSPEDDYFPPAILPIPAPAPAPSASASAGATAGANVSSAGRSDSAFSNRFSSLSIAEDDHDFSQAEHKEAAENNVGGARASAGASRRPVQNRYVRMYAVAGVTECIRQEAINALKEKLYEDSSAAWSYAYDYLKTYLEADFMTEWMIALYHEELVHESIDGHDCAELRRVLEALKLVYDHTEEEKVKSLDRLASRRTFLMSKLAPAIQDRDQTKRDLASKKGEDWWKSNPEPKQTYAEKRKAWEEELKLVEDAMMVLGNLRIQFELEE